MALTLVVVAVVAAPDREVSVSVGSMPLGKHMVDRARVIRHGLAQVPPHVVTLRCPRTVEARPPLLPAFHGMPAASSRALIVAMSAVCVAMLAVWLAIVAV